MGGIECLVNVYCCHYQPYWRFFFPLFYILCDGSKRMLSSCGLFHSPHNSVIDNFSSIMLWIELCPSERLIEVLTSRNLLRNRVFPDVFALRRCHTGLHGPQSHITIVSLWEENTHKHTQWHVTMEADIGVMNLQAKECQGLLATPRSWEKAKEDPSLELSDILISDFYPPEVWQNKILEATQFAFHIYSMGFPSQMSLPKNCVTYSCFCVWSSPHPRKYLRKCLITVVCVRNCPVLLGVFFFLIHYTLILSLPLNMIVQQKGMTQNTEFFYLTSSVLGNNLLSWELEVSRVLLGHRESSFASGHS